MAVKSTSGKIKRGYYENVAFERTLQDCKYNQCCPERNWKTEKNINYKIKEERQNRK